MNTETKQQITREQIEKLSQREKLENLGADEIFELIRGEEQLKSYIPDEMYQIDPRDGAVILYNSARAKRPHDNPREVHAEDEGKECPVCEGKTTGIIDIAELSEGYTFINKNLFPVLYPSDKYEADRFEEAPEKYHAAGSLPWGGHLLQWTSSFHDKDWYNMPLEDRRVVLKRLALLEEKLLSPAVRAPKERYVSIIKNYGSPVGGSLVHGHQQIGMSNMMPRRLKLDEEYLRRRGELFSDTVLRENPADLTVKDYGAAVLLVPWFMKRPYNMMFFVKDTLKQHLYELQDEEIDAAANGLRDATAAIMEIMPRIGKLTAYNITVHNGPGSGLYFEFLPYTQETGGFEHLGLWVCQGNPKSAAEELRKAVTQICYNS
jgi:galactose-1-phosphate uridylyltransferase